MGDEGGKGVDIWVYSATVNADALYTDGVSI